MEASGGAAGMKSMRVRIAQILCRDRHCIVAVPYLSEEGQTDAAITDGLAIWVLDGIKPRWLVDGVLTAINPWCGLCGSHDLHVEDRPTKFSTLEEALPALRKAELEQATTRAAWGKF